MAAMPCGLARLSVRASGGTSHASPASAASSRSSSGDVLRVAQRGGGRGPRGYSAAQHGDRPVAGMAARHGGRRLGRGAGQDEQRQARVEGNGGQAIRGDELQAGGWIHPGCAG